MRQKKKTLPILFGMLLALLVIPMMPKMVAKAEETLIIKSVNSDYVDSTLGDYGGEKIRFRPVEGAVKYMGKMLEVDSEGKTLLQIQNVYNYTVEDSGNYCMYWSEANFKSYGYGTNNPYFSFTIYAYDSHDNVIASNTRIIQRKLTVLDQPIVQLDSSGVAHVQSDSEVTHAYFYLYEVKLNYTSASTKYRVVTDKMMRISDHNEMIVDFSEYMEEGYEYCVKVRGVSDNHFYRNSGLGNSGDVLKKDTPTISMVFEDQELELEKPNVISIEAMNAKSYEWKIYDGDVEQTAATVKSHIAFSGRTSKQFVVIPKDDWLHGKRIACEVTNENGSVLTRKANISLRAKLSAITISGAKVETGMLISDFKSNVSINKSYMKIDSIDVRDNYKNVKVSDTDSFQSAYRRPLGYTAFITLVKNTEVSVDFDLSAEKVSIDAKNGIVEAIYATDDYVEITIGYYGADLKDKTVSMPPLYTGDPLFTDVSKFQVPEDAGYEIVAVNWGTLKGSDNNKTLGQSDKTVKLFLTLSPNGLNELIYDDVANSTVKLNYKDTEIMGEFFGYVTDTQFSKDETITYYFEINDIGNTECVYKLNGLSANSKDIIANRTSVEGAVAFQLIEEGEITFVASKDKTADYGDKIVLEGTVSYEINICKLSDDGTYDSLNPNLVLKQQSIAQKDVATLENGDYFVVVNAKNQKYNLEESTWGAFKLAIHTIHEPSADWNHDENGHWHVCAFCGEKVDEDVHSDANADEICDVCGQNIHKHVGIEVAQVDATCEKEGVKAYYECSCGKFFADEACDNEISDLTAWKSGDGKIAMKKHTLTTTVYKATPTADGKKETKCSECGKVTKTVVINAAKTIKLSKSEYVYDGKSKKPAVIVKDKKGNTIAKANYSVSYDKGRETVGQYKVKVTLKGNYKGSKTLSFVINPKPTTIKKVTPDKKSFTVTWEKQTKEVTGYEIQYSTKKNFASECQTVEIKKNTTVKQTIKDLNANKTYYVRVRTYKTVKGKKYYASWSKEVKVTTKK